MNLHGKWETIDQPHTNPYCDVPSQNRAICGDKLTFTTASEKSVEVEIV